MAIVPAYGRDYTSKKAVLADFDADKDFQIRDMSDPDDGRYVNKSGLKAAGRTSVMVRYSKLMKITNISVK